MKKIKSVGGVWIPFVQVSKCMENCIPLVLVRTVFDKDKVVRAAWNVKDECFFPGSEADGVLEGNDGARKAAEREARAFVEVRSKGKDGSRYEDIGD